MAPIILVALTTHRTPNFNFK